MTLRIYTAWRPTSCFPKTLPWAVTLAKGLSTDSTLQLQVLTRSPSPRSVLVSSLPHLLHVLCSPRGLGVPFWKWKPSQTPFLVLFTFTIWFAVFLHWMFQPHPPVRKQAVVPVLFPAYSRDVLSEGTRCPVFSQSSSVSPPFWSCSLVKFPPGYFVIFVAIVNEVFSPLYFLSSYCYHTEHFWWLYIYFLSDHLNIFFKF